MEAFVAPGQARMDDCRGPSQSLEENKAHIGVALPSVKDGLRKQIEEELQSEERSKTNLALIEEALRYGSALNPCGLLASGDGRVTIQGETPLRMLNAPGLVEDETVIRWELMEAQECGRWASLDFIGVYGPFSREDRGLYVGGARAIRGIWDDPWCLGGDFNVILSQGERSSQGRLTGAMRRFAHTVDELELLDLPLQGGALTWSGGRNNQAWARLDRFLVTQNWLDHFSGVVQSRLPRPTLDHFPILLMGGGLRRVPRLGLKICGLKLMVLRTFFGDGGRGLSERSLSEGEIELKKEGKESLKKWVLMEEIHWRQLSRDLWLKEGDRNTDFFHRMTNAHRRNNYLDRIKINGVWMTEEQEVREGIVNAFWHLLSEEPGWRADIEGLYLNHLNSREAEVLELPFTEEEIHSALMEMNGDKALGPDGFTVAFWQACWDFVKEEIVDFFKQFYFFFDRQREPLD
ncbi:hypothetical protein CK203_008528 [Vitis vinifera]|uniref:Uncharacterized protein n=1 Tax=Vitis vinifera TaxID=29760 RepID=A0A438KDD5_VITVI|nr:hypothetical protein CK203_008528 [Vitis vinifera]